MRKIHFILITSILLVFSSGVFAQEIKRSSFYLEETLNYKSFQKNSHGSQIISLLASNNVQSLPWVEIHIRANMMVRLMKAEVGQVSASIILTKYILNGEVFFRDFLVDSLLMPDMIEGRITLFDGKKELLTRPWLIVSRSGQIDLHVPDTVTVADENLRAEVHIERMMFSKQRYDALTKLTESINNYYSYVAVFQNLTERYRKNDLGKNQPPSHLMVSWDEISRVNKNVENHHFQSLLNLDQLDPELLLPLIRKSKRLEKRASTLVSWILKSNIKGVISDKKHFCNNYVNLSIKYLELAADVQPYLKDGFAENARIVADDQVINMIKHAARMYDVFNHLSIPETPQLIYDQFVEQATVYAENGNFVAAMLLLDNAVWFEATFDPVQRSQQFTEVYLKVLDGLMSSYLTVAIMAYQSGSFDMAETYHQKAQEIYRRHHEQFVKEEVLSTSLVNYARQQVDLAHYFIADNKYREALRLLDEAKQINLEMKAEPENGKLDKAYALSHRGIISVKLDSLFILIDRKNPADALTALEEVNLYSSAHHNYLNGDYDHNIRTMATTLFGVYFREGERLLRSKKPEMALLAFLEAQSINDIYIHQPNEKLDSLIYESTVPVILAITKNAEFATWAGRMDQATALYDEAIELQSRYKQERNVEINEAILALRIKMDNRICVNLGNECFALEKRLKNRIKSAKYREAKIFLDAAFMRVQQNPECTIDDTGLIQLQLQYADAFSYNESIDKTKDYLRKGLYDKTIQAYLLLGEMYEKNNINRFGITKPDLDRFIKEENEIGLTKAGVEYYATKNQYDKAFQFLVMLKEKGSHPKEVRALQESVGEGLAEDDRGNAGDSKVQIDKYTNGDKWFRYFRLAYLRHLR